MGTGCRDRGLWQLLALAALLASGCQLSRPAASARVPAPEPAIEVSGLGIVMELSGTGDGDLLMPIKGRLEQVLGRRVEASELENMAMVTVVGRASVSAAPGDRVHTRVYSQGQATSLAGGRLLRTELGCQLYPGLRATAQGRINVNRSRPTDGNLREDAIVISSAEEVITDFAFSPESLIDRPFDAIRDAEVLSLDDLLDKDRRAALERIRQLPKLTTLKFYRCDLSKVDEDHPVPAKVHTVLISGGKVSQGTVRWLAKFPAGTTLVFGCDVRGLEFNLGKFSWVTFDNCEMSRSAIVKLVENTTQVTFKEVTLVE